MGRWAVGISVGMCVFSSCSFSFNFLKLGLLFLGVAESVLSNVVLPQGTKGITVLPFSSAPFKGQSFSAGSYACTDLLGPDFFLGQEERRAWSLFLAPLIPVSGREEPLHHYLDRPTNLCKGRGMLLPILCLQKTAPCIKSKASLTTAFLSDSQIASTLVPSQKSLLSSSLFVKYG